MKGKKNKSKNEKEYILIKDYYQRALKAIESDGLEVGSKILLKEMPVDLYDLSLDILDNSNNEFSDESLRSLIKKVDKKLSNSSDENFEEPDIKDKFSRKTF